MDRFPKFNMVISAPPQLIMWHNDVDGDNRRTLNKDLYVRFGHASFYAVYNREFKISYREWNELHPLAFAVTLLGTMVFQHGPSLSINTRVITLVHTLFKGYENQGTTKYYFVAPVILLDIYRTLGKCKEGHRVDDAWEMLKEWKNAKRMGKDIITPDRFNAGYDEDKEAKAVAELRELKEEANEKIERMRYESLEDKGRLGEGFLLMLRKIERVTREIQRIKEEGLKVDITTTIYKAAAATLDEDLASQLKRKKEEREAKIDIKTAVLLAKSAAFDEELATHSNLKGGKYLARDQGADNSGPDKEPIEEDEEEEIVYDPPFPIV
ncbi:hypothetical protein EJD97_007724 [Solanum chilense]|uniref:Uncharacterized protein n=1 Tax=Solanum chilense TaxID=4083 RepID=A0A6N2AH71_SOLCI|nr:hypothetical protein EJD97_007724 [Solanum chilense]